MGNLEYEYSHEEVAVIEQNVLLLRLAFRPAYEVEERVIDRDYAIYPGERRFLNKSETATNMIITLVYDSQTGSISRRPTEKTYSHNSLFHSLLESEDYSTSFDATLNQFIDTVDKTTILLSWDSNDIPAINFMEARGYYKPEVLEMYGQMRLPERMISPNIHAIHPMEIWGDAPGDKVFLASLKVFNERYGHPQADGIWATIGAFEDTS